MPKPFRLLTIQQFADELARFRFTRTVSEVHMHHTFIPRKTDFAGVSTIESMFRHHTRVRGFSDIAQHLSIDPNGGIWTGRDWNVTPASATGHNGRVFMFETIGNFDRGQERLEGAQRRAVIEVIARVQLRLGLPLESLHFHREFSTKTCPGSGITKQEILDEVRRRHAELAGSRGFGAAAEPADPMAGSRTRSAFAGPEGAARNGRVRPFADSEMERDLALEADDLDDVLEDPEEGGVARGPGDMEGFGARDELGRGGLTPEEMDALRPHVVNLRQGRFSEEGAMQTSPGDVDAIFDEHLPAALAAARGRGQPLRILFYAHGGLVSEASGLHYAREVVSWWKENGVYPLFFVWETGIWDALAQILSGRRELAARGLSDLTDRAVEAAARRLGGPRIWGAMKYSAQASVGEDGGALYVARKLAAFCRAASDVELHAVGHSAGAVFHSFFIPAAVQEGAPSFRTGSFLAPAIRVDAFHDRLAAMLGAGKGVDALAVFTMRTSFELGDRCGPLYRKSLLYLIHHALEARRGEPLLGLEVSLRGDPRLRALFGLAGAPGTHEVVWSTTAAATGRSASRSTTHGGFDNDAPTMESVARRILGAADADPVVPFPESAARSFTFGAETDAVEAYAPPADEGPEEEESPAPPRDEDGGRRGNKRALCVGIDRYPGGAQLAGCVNDTEQWAGELRGLGFEVEKLLNEQATEAAIKGALERLVTGSRPG
ncbi:MAG TPA: caspase family protein, partial [Longimicrobium sp.]|nr:caspase family protein [Longimicrobium sp.]